MKPQPQSTIVWRKHDAVGALRSLGNTNRDRTQKPSRGKCPNVSARDRDDVKLERLQIEPVGAGRPTHKAQGRPNPRGERTGAGTTSTAIQTGQPPPATIQAQVPGPGGWRTQETSPLERSHPAKSDVAQYERALQADHSAKMSRRKPAAASGRRGVPLHGVSDGMGVFVKTGLRRNTYATQR